MKRRSFLGNLAIGGGAIIAAPMETFHIGDMNSVLPHVMINEKTLLADVAIIGGGLGGYAAAMVLLKNGFTVIMTEETDWIGGQLTQQCVPPDEHQWIEFTGATQLYRDFRNKIRDYYRRNYPLKAEIKDNPYLNPGGGTVSKLCHEPKVALAVLHEMINPFLSSGKLNLLLEHKAINVDTKNDFVEGVVVKNLNNNSKKLLKANYFIDATELGDLLPLAGVDFVTGSESKSETNELHAPETSDPENVQAFTTCFAMDYIAGGNFTIEKPSDYKIWKDFVPQMTPPWPGKLLSLQYSHPATLLPKNLGFHPEGKPTGDALNLWNYRKIMDKNNFRDGFYQGDITLVNWPQNDYTSGNLIGKSDADFTKHFESSKQQSLSLLYWLQTEVPRPDGGKGWPGLRLRKDIPATADGLAKYPYIRESRRIKAVFTILEEHVGKENFEMISGRKSNTAEPFFDSVGIGYYHIDLHPTCGNVNYIDFPSLRFQIPLGALLPVKMKNLLPSNKNIGTTHITNGCYRLHPVEWNIGESVGLLISFSITEQVTPHEVRENKSLLNRFQQYIRKNGIETEWPEEETLSVMEAKIRKQIQ